MLLTYVLMELFMIFKSARLLAAFLVAVTLPVCAQNLAVVNGKSIPSSRAEAMLKQMAEQGQADSPQLRAMVKEELISREIAMQEAGKQGIDAMPEVKQQLELARQAIFVRALMSSYLKNHPVSDGDIKAEYVKFKDQAGDKEYHVRHILVDHEDDAKEIINQLNGGARFEDLAKRSKDSGSASNGGDLDWAFPASFVKPFSDAMIALREGQITETPVKTQFGYHIIKLDNVRLAMMPSLEEVGPQITQSLQQNKIAAYQKELRSKAKIQ